MAIFRIVTDERERPSGVPAALERLGVKVTYRMLDIGDYLVSEEVAVERKRVADLVSSLYEGRLFEQTQRLSETYRTPLLIIEGEHQALLEAIPNRRALWGALTSLSLLSGIYVFQTASPQETAELLHSIAAREASGRTRRPLVSFRRLGRKQNVLRMQLLLVSGLPGIGPKLAHRLLSQYATVRAVFSSSAAELATVRGLGKARAERIAAFLDTPYDKAPERQVSRLTE
ncbi:MAG: ERCC4 domain-containing protein [Candidatus Bathyarchaeia archaeon]